MWVFPGGQGCPPSRQRANAQHKRHHDNGCPRPFGKLQVDRTTCENGPKPGVSGRILEVEVEAKTE